MSQNNERTHAGVADINLYSEFTVTVCVPVVGLLLIYLCYRIRLCCIQKRVDHPFTDVKDVDTEKGDHLAQVSEEFATGQRRTRDICIWLAIGWLFILYTVRAARGRLYGLHVPHSKSILYDSFVWAHRALNHYKRRLPGRYYAGPPSEVLHATTW
jgi:hypothetical protein